MRWRERERESEVPRRARLSLAFDTDPEDLAWLGLRTVFVQIARRMTKTFDPDDIAQASILRVLQSRSLSPDRKLPTGYAHRIVRSVIVDRVRAEQKISIQDFPVEVLTTRQVDGVDLQSSERASILPLLKLHLRASDRSLLDTLRGTTSIREAARNLGIQPQQLRRRIRDIARRLRLQFEAVREQLLLRPRE